MDSEKLIEDMLDACDKRAKEFDERSVSWRELPVEQANDVREIFRAALAIAERAIAEEWREKAAQHVAGMNMSDFFGRDGTRAQDNAAAAIRALPLPGEE